MRFIIILSALTVLAHASVITKNSNGKAFDQSKVKFYLYTRRNIDTYQEMFVGNLNNANYNVALPNKYIIHSDNEGYDEPWVQDMKLQLLNSYDCNVIVIEWRENANGLYGDARDNTRPTGEFVGTFINYISDTVGGNRNITHCIGFGLGAHACGFAGKVQPTNVNIARITGLDLNDDGFDFNDPTTRLHVNDADFVDVIHTCTEQYSFSEKIGDADFYPNSGSCDQPGCGWVIDGTCSHERAYEYYTESIRTIGFQSTLCESWGQFEAGNCGGTEKVPMGDQCPSTALGLYYLYTYDSYPYAMG